MTIDYNNTVIYKIVCKNEDIKDVYVGCTTNFNKRRIDHKKNCNNAIYKQHNLKIYQTIRANGGWENFEMIEIIKQPCKNITESHTLERHYYDLLNCNMNTVVPNRTQKEYYKNNKEYYKEYYKNNKDKLLKYQNEYNAKQKNIK